MPTVFFFWVLLLGFPSHQQATSPAAPVSLDYEFFKAKVEPIFLAKRPGHARCVACHGHPYASGFALVHLPADRTTWNEEESRKNFEEVKHVVVPGNLQSPLLVHPLAESAGGDFFHSGGKHFDSQKDAEWLMLKAWVMGQKLAANPK